MSPPIVIRQPSQLQRDRAELRDLDAEIGLAVVPADLRARLGAALKVLDAMLVTEWYAAAQGQTPAVEQALERWRAQRARIARRASNG